MFDEFLLNLMNAVPDGIPGLVILLAIIAAALFVLSKGADILVDSAVALSEKWGVPKMLIGATVVSLGTTLPEVTVSVMSALKGAPGLAMGNAVGSVICDTGLILGIAALIKPLPFKKTVVNRQGWIQLGAGILLVAVSFIAGGGIRSFSEGGSIPRVMGFVFLGLLAAYIVSTIAGARKGTDAESRDTDNPSGENGSSVAVILLKMILGAALVILSSKVLIPAVQETALRFRIPETVIAATLVAFGTSLPELITAITAARKGHGDLAIGNIIGADILNVLFVIGASAAVTPGGLTVDVNFFRILFPAMLFVLIVFRCGVLFSKNSLKRPVGFVLLAAYVAVTALSYVSGV
ncbi:calcium/sodium antiporter [Treponema brennaborense]|uniref:Na+/Ca+ antiporter, CaCA family n=1 Tax=Treponema brennaborense (strain DSM 12168 / CIP 105900 / DD5/3) TaxID=906968 RepID=F4LKK6_TREBD|nr:calcium/sodium antiporter [Treponema brennaborense]AEE17562.1 Na+/Ca+ antiporter, CaCA family [Treponema brennaborense DSM 12168]